MDCLFRNDLLNEIVYPFFFRIPNLFMALVVWRTVKKGHPPIFENSTTGPCKTRSGVLSWNDPSAKRPRRKKRFDATARVSSVWSSGAFSLLRVVVGIVQHRQGSSYLYSWTKIKRKKQRTRTGDRNNRSVPKPNSTKSQTKKNNKSWGTSCPRFLGGCVSLV